MRNLRHCEECFTPRRNEAATLATLLYNGAGLRIQNDIGPLQLFRMKSSSDIAVFFNF
jgi:hypothetical protein